MATFIDKTKDFKGFLSNRILTSLNNEYDSELNNAENLAIGMVTDACASKYDIEGELAKTGTSRNATLIRWMAVLTSYLMMGSIADADIPERVVKNYDDVVAELKAVNAGKMSVQLDRRVENGEKVTRFNYGSETRRTHNAF
jgi:phage gp36-like protein